MQNIASAILVLKAMRCLPEIQSNCAAHVFIHYIRPLYSYLVCIVTIRIFIDLLCSHRAKHLISWPLALLSRDSKHG